MRNSQGKLFSLGVLLFLLMLNLKSQNQWIGMVVYSSIESAEKEKDQVQKLVLKRKKLTSFPKEIRSYPNLKYLDLSKNKIQEIPSWIGEMENLEYLCLSKNQLSILPSNLFLCKELIHLDLGSNVLYSIPKLVENLKNLEVLTIWDNEISDLPIELSTLKKLKKIDLRAILFSEEEQRIIKEKFPNVIIYMDNSCNCGD